MQIDATRHLNPTETHKEFFRNSDRELLFYGGAGSGKSYSAADKLILAPILWKQPITGIAAGSNLPSLKRTSLRLLEKRLTEFGVPYTLNRTDLILDYYVGTPIESKLFILGVHDSDRTQGGRLKSITDIDLIWVEELTEVDRQGYFELKRRLRGPLRTPIPGAVAPYRQIYSTFNPIGLASWVYEHFWLSQTAVPRIHTMARRDNPYVDQEYLTDLDEQRQYSESDYRVYALGEWAELANLIYAGYSTVPYWELPKGEQILETIHGLDFGFNHPCALVTIHILKDGAILRERMYQTGLRTSDLIESLRDLNLGKEPIYADTARPDLISELRLAGYNILDADKSSVIDSISYCQKLMPFLRISDDSTNLLKELKSYQWAKGPNGVIIDKPVKLHDDLCLTGDTLVTTDNGDVRLDSIRPGDRVLTRKGYRTVLAAGCTGVKPVATFSLLGTTITGTPDHNVLTNRGKVALSELRPEDEVTILEGEWKRLPYSTGPFIGDTRSLQASVTGCTTPAERRDGRGRRSFIGTYGKPTMDRYRKAIISTIRTVIRSITISRISRLFHGGSTYPTIRNSTESGTGKPLSIISRIFVRLRSTGTLPKKEGDGIPNTPRRHTRIADLEPSFVSTAAKNTRREITAPPFSAPPRVGRLTEGSRGWIMKSVSAGSVEVISSPPSMRIPSAVQSDAVLNDGGSSERPVYNLTIDGEHEYFANGLLVANCDSMRYGLFTHRYRIPFGRQRSHMPERKSIVPQWWRDLIGDGGQQRTGAMGL